MLALQERIVFLLRRAPRDSAALRSAVYQRDEYRCHAEGTIDDQLFELRDAGIIAYAGGKWYLRNHERQLPAARKRETDPRQLKMFE